MLVSMVIHLLLTFLLSFLNLFLLLRSFSHRSECAAVVRLKTTRKARLVEASDLNKKIANTDLFYGCPLFCDARCQLNEEKRIVQPHVDCRRTEARTPNPSHPGQLWTCDGRRFRWLSVLLLREYSTLKGHVRSIMKKDGNVINGSA